VCTSQDFTNIYDIKCNETFLAYLLSKEMRKEALNVQGTSIKGIPSAQIKSKEIYLPSIFEQEKIASFLSLIDEKILSQKKTIEELKVLKTVLSKKVFLQQLRFKDDNGNDFPDWEIFKLKDIA